MTTQVHGLGSELYVEISSTFHKINHITTITGPNLGTRTKEVTNLDSASAEYIATINESGELSFECEYDPGDSTHAALFGGAVQGITTNWKESLADTNNTTVVIAGILTSAELSGMEAEGVLMLSCKVQLSGAPTFS